jgi:hypothetical protein
VDGKLTEEQKILLSLFSGGNEHIARLFREVFFIANNSSRTQDAKSKWEYNLNELLKIISKGVTANTQSNIFKAQNELRRLGVMPSTYSAMTVPASFMSRMKQDRLRFRIIIERQEIKIEALDNDTDEWYKQRILLMIRSIFKFFPVPVRAEFNVEMTTSPTDLTVSPEKELYIASSRFPSGQHKATVYLHPYWSSLKFAKQFEIMVHELASHLGRNQKDEDLAMAHTLEFMKDRTGLQISCIKFGELMLQVTKRKLTGRLHSCKVMKL